MDVEVPDTLTDPRVGGDERALGTKRLLYGDRSSTHRSEDRRQQPVGQVIKRLDVRRWHHQHVTGQEWGAIEEGDNVLIAKDDVRRELAVSDLTEQTRRSHPLEGRPQHHESNDCEHDEILDAADGDVAWIA